MRYALTSVVMYPSKFICRHLQNYNEQSSRAMVHIDSSFIFASFFDDIMTMSDVIYDFILCAVPFFGICWDWRYFFCSAV